MEVSRKKQSQLPWKWACALSFLAHVLFGVLFALVPWLPLQSDEATKKSPAGAAFLQERTAWDPAFAGPTVVFASAGSNRNASKYRTVGDTVPFKMVLEPALNQTYHNRGGTKKQRSVANPQVKSQAHGGLPKSHGKPSTFFDLEVNARRIVFVVDSSSSMGESGGFERVRQELTAAVESLSTEMQFQILVFGTQARPLLRKNTGLMPATPSNKRLVVKALQSLKAEGRTIHRDALPLALTYLPEVIFFVTDGGDLSVQYVRQVSEANRGRAVIHVLQPRRSHFDPPDALLQILAKRNGGRFQAIVNLSLTAGQISKRTK